MTLPIPTSPVIYPDSVTGWLDRGSHFVDPTTGSTYSKTVNYVGKNVCGQDDYAHIASQWQILARDTNCTKYAIASGSLKLTLPHNYTVDDAQGGLNFFKKTIPLVSQE